MNTERSVKNVNLTVKPINYGLLAAYACMVNVNKQLCNVSEFKFSSLRNVFLVNSCSSAINRTLSFSIENNGFVFYCMSACTSSKSIAFSHLRNVWIVRDFQKAHHLLQVKEVTLKIS